MNKVGMLCVVTTVLVLIGGCSESSRSKVDPYSLVYCGGKTLDASCIVIFEDESNGKYLSEQEHRICLSNPYIEITSNEPTGASECKLSGADFYVKKPVPDNIHPVACDSLYAKLIQTLMTVGNLGAEAAGGSANTMEMFGTDYKTVTLNPGPVGLSALEVHKVPCAQIKLYANTEKGVIDRVTVKNLKSGAELSGYAYNWRNISEINKKVPSKIDIFMSGDWDVDVNPAIQINYLDFKINTSEVLTQK